MPVIQDETVKRTIAITVINNSGVSLTVSVVCKPEKRIITVFPTDPPVS